jgi:ankyrin repeat protein
MTPQEATKELFKAAINGDDVLATTTLDAGAVPTAKDDHWQTPLLWAAAYNNADTARLLIDKGADVNARDKNQETPLHYAAGNSNADTTRLLIAKGADVNARNCW